MKLIARPLTEEAFRPYGRFVNVFDCDADPSAPLAYYPDVGSVALGSPIAGIGVLHEDPQPAVMEQMEMHTGTEEGWIVLNGDCVACFGTPCEDPNAAVYEAFFFRAGTVVSLYPRVWHYAPFACGKGRTAVLAILPPNTPENDIVVKPLNEPCTIEPT